MGFLHNFLVCVDFLAIPQIEIAAKEISREYYRRGNRWMQLQEFQCVALAHCESSGRIGLTGKFSDGCSKGEWRTFRGRLWIHQFTFIQCAAQNCRNILLDLEVTKCGEMVVFHRTTLERIYQDKSTRIEAVASMTFDELRKIDISKNHPLGFVTVLFSRQRSWI